MNTTDLNTTLQSKIAEFEVGMELGKPHAELRELYKQIKELQYQLTMLQATGIGTDCQPITYSHFSTKAVK